MACKIRGPLRRAARLQITWRSHHHPPHVADGAGDDAGIRQMPDAHRKVDAFIHQIDHPVRQPQFGADLGILFQISGHHRPDMEPPEHLRR